MKKIINIVLLFMFLLPFDANSFEYKRKKINQNYFIPTSDLVVNTKYDSPKFTKVKKTGVKNKIVKDVDVIDFQDKFNQYKKDVDKIKKNGFVEETAILRSDLSRMNTNAKYKVN